MECPPSVGVPCAAEQDSHQQLMAAAMMTPGDVAVVISNTGMTRSVIEVARIVRENGAKVVGLIGAPSPLVEHCDAPVLIETLDTDSAVLLALLAMKPREGVIFHSIIGSERPGPVAQSTDGIVPYRSAHLDGVASEVRVRSDHGVQKNAKAINEVHRILLEHLGFRTAGPTDEEVTPATPDTRR